MTRTFHEANIILFKKSNNAKKMIGPFNMTQKSYTKYYISKSNNVF